MCHAKNVTRPASYNYTSSNGRFPAAALSAGRLPAIAAIDKASPPLGDGTPQIYGYTHFLVSTAL